MIVGVLVFPLQIFEMSRGVQFIIQRYPTYKDIQPTKMSNLQRTPLHTCYLYNNILLKYGILIKMRFIQNLIHRDILLYGISNQLAI